MPRADRYPGQIETFLATVSRRPRPSRVPSFFRREFRLENKSFVSGTIQSEFRNPEVFSGATSRLRIIVSLRAAGFSRILATLVPCRFWRDKLVGIAAEARFVKNSRTVQLSREVSRGECVTRAETNRRYRSEPVNCSAGHAMRVIFCFLCNWLCSCICRAGAGAHAKNNREIVPGHDTFPLFLSAVSRPLIP